MSRKSPAPVMVQTGQTLTCAETGLAFVADPRIPNFILHPVDGVLSFDGLLARSLRDLADYTGPLTCYLALNGKTATNRLGAKLGDVMQEVANPGGTTTLRIRDLNGRWWRGLNKGRGRILNLRPMADPTLPKSKGDLTRILLDAYGSAAIMYGAHGHDPDYLPNLNAARAALDAHLHLKEKP